MGEDTTQILKRLESVWLHIQGVQRNGYQLAERLIEAGEIQLGVQLAQNVLRHDQSKLAGIEWEGLDYSGTVDKEVLAQAVTHHNRTNEHHPEYWGGIQQMPRVFLAELVCDWKTRSSELGTALQEWIDENATKRFKFGKRTKVYKEITYFVKLLLEKPFVKLPP